MSRYEFDPFAFQPTRDPQATHQSDATARFEQIDTRRTFPDFDAKTYVDAEDKLVDNPFALCDDASECYRKAYMLPIMIVVVLLKLEGGSGGSHVSATDLQARLQRVAVTAHRTFTQVSDDNTGNVTAVWVQSIAQQYSLVSKCVLLRPATSATCESEPALLQYFAFKELPRLAR